MNGVCGEPSSTCEDVEDNDIYIPFLCSLITREANKKDRTKLDSFKRAYAIMTNKNESNRESYVSVRNYVKEIYSKHMQKDKSGQKSTEKKELPAASERGEHSGVSRFRAVNREIHSPDGGKRTSHSARSPSKAQNKDENEHNDIVVINPDEECLQVGKVCADIRRLSHESGDTSCKLDETNDHKVRVVHYFDWKFIPICGLQFKSASSSYSASVSGNSSDPRLRSMPSTLGTSTVTTKDLPVVDDLLEMDSMQTAVETEDSSEEPTRLAFDNQKLAELLEWAKDRIQSGINVENICNVPIDHNGSGDRDTSVDNGTESGQHQPAAAIKTEAASETYYRDVTPFHLLVPGAAPLTSVKIEQGAPSAPGTELFRRKKKKRKKKVKTEPGIQTINCRGEIIDVEYEARRRERKLAEEKEKEEAAKRAKEVAEASKADTRDSGKVAELESLTVDDSDDESRNVRASGAGCAMAERKSHEHYVRFLEDKRREEEWLRKEERRKREEKRDAQRREDRARRHKQQQQQYEEQQRFAMMNQNNPFGYGVPMMPMYPMPFYPQMPNVYGQPFVAPYAPMHHPHPQIQTPQIQQVQMDENVSCIFCPFSGEHSLIMNHYVNDHLDKEPPVRISADQLKSILRGEIVEEDQGKKEKVPTGVPLLDDLSWIPMEIRFLELKTCKLCKYSTNIRRNLIEHVQSHRKAVLNQRTEEKSYHCRFCPIIMTDIKKFHEHCTSHTGEFMYACGLCGFRGYTSEEVREHSNREHPGRNVQIKRNGTVFGGTTVCGYVCPECGFVQMAEKKVESHIHSVHRKQHVQVKKINMAKVIPKPPIVPQSGQQATVSGPPSTPSRPVEVPSKGPPRDVAKRRPPVKIRGDPRTAPFRNNVEPSPPVDRRRSGAAGQRPQTPHKSLATPIGPLLENGLLEGDDRNEPDNIPETSSNTITVEEIRSVNTEKEQVESRQQPPVRSSTVTVPSYLRHCKLECVVGIDETAGSGDDSQHLTDTEDDEQETFEGGTDIPVQAELQGEMEEEESKLLTEEMELMTDMDIGEPTQAAPSEIANVKCEDENGVVDNNNSDIPSVAGTGSAGESSVMPIIADVTGSTRESTGLVVAVDRPGSMGESSGMSATANGPGNSGESSGMPTIADTISKLTGHLQSKSVGMNKKTKNTSAQTSSITPRPTSSVNPDNTSILSPTRINDWQLRMKSLICNCGFLCVSTEAFTKHRAHWHKGERRIHCVECNTRCEDVMAFTEHFHKTCNKITKKMFVCSLEPLCRFFTSSQQQFLSHIGATHNNLEWLPCHWCGKQYTTPDCLVTHIHRMCTAKEKLLSALQTALVVTKTEVESLDFSSDVTDVESLRDPPAAPRLEVVYRCAFSNCKHRSLEREVFFDHMHVLHPDRTDYACIHCEGVPFRNLNSLILHIEEKHREGADAEEVAVSSDEVRIVPPTQLIDSVPSTSSAAIVADDQSVDVSSVDHLSASEEPPDDAEPPPDSEDGAMSIEGPSPLADISRFTLGSMEATCRAVALHFQVLSSSTLDGEVFRENLRNWRTLHIGNKGNIHPLTFDPKDLVAFVREHKSAEALRSLINVRKLVHLYKCGSRNCSFTTDDENKFRSHLSGESCRDGSVMLCLYCGESHKTVRGITDHITLHHGESVNQCLECTFRCRQIGSILIHAKKRHDGETASSIKCEAPTVPESNENLDNEGPDLLSLIMPVLCTADECDFITMDIMAIQGHIRESHPTLSIYDCFYCGHKVDLRDLEIHFERHNIYKFQCRYCSFGTNNGNEIVVHLCEMHPHRTGRVFIRTTMTHHETNSGTTPRNVPVPPPPPPSIPSTSSTLPGGITIKDEPVDEPPVCPEAIASPDPQPSTSVGSAVIPTTTSSSAAANLFSCGYQQCRFSAPTILALDEHIQECSKKNANARLCCKQCRMPFRNMTSFLNHVRSHQAKLYYCGLCDYSRQLIYYVKNHMQTVHGLQFTETKCVPRYPSGSESDMAEFVFEPTLPSLRIRIDPNVGAAVIPPTQAPVVTHVERVGDIDSVPVQSIFAKEIKCAHCDFATKVRTNLIRHLELHKRNDNAQREALKSVLVDSTPSIGPGNDSVLVDPGLRLWHPTVFPEYFSKEERYRCCVRSCCFLASDSANFEDHVSKEHPNLLVFGCPHCPTNTDVMANLIRHLSLHGPNLYKCPYCTYVNVGRQLVLGHGLAEHPGVPNYVNIVREKQELNIRSNLLGRMSSQSASQQTDRIHDDEQPSGSGTYSCPLCKKFQTANLMQMKCHMFNELNYKKYACNHCSTEMTRKGNMIRHLRNYHPDKSTNSFTVNRNENIEKFVADALEKSDNSTATATRAAHHTSKVSKPDVVEGPPRIHCPHCPYSGTKENVVRNHILSHLHNQSYSCRFCRSHFTRVHQLRSHHNAQHPGAHFEHNEITNEPDKDIAAFVDWVLKLVQDPAIQSSQSNFNLKPWTLPCKYDGCSRQFSSLKKFGDHFKADHLHEKSKRKNKDGAAETDSSQDDDNVVMVYNASPKRPYKRRKLDSNGPEPAPAYISLCPFCSYSKSGMPLTDHLLRHYDCRFYKCKYCNFEGFDLKDVREHTKRNHVGFTFAFERLKMPEVVTIRKVGNREHFLIERGSLGQNYILNPDPGGQYWCYKCKYASHCMNSARYHCQYAHGIGTYIRSRNTDPILPVSTSPNTTEVVIPNDDGGENGGKNSVECTMCDKVLPDMNVWLQHFNAEHIDPSESANQSSNRKRKRGKQKASGTGKGFSAAFQCKYCSYNCLQVAMMKRHQQTQHPNMEVLYEKVENASVHQCPKCSYTSTDSSDATTHILSHIHQFKCGLCDKTASTERGIQRHSASIHSMHRVRVIKNPEYEKQKLELEGRIMSLRATREEISVENVCIQDGLEYQVLSSNPSCSTADADATVSSESLASSPLCRTVARKSTCRSTQKSSPSDSVLMGTKVKNKRKIDYPLALQFDDGGISHYGKRATPIDTKNLTVFTNFRGMRNARTTVDHLGEIFNLNPIVVVEKNIPSSKS